MSRYDFTIDTAASDGTYVLAGLQPGQYRAEFKSGCGLSGYQAQWWKAARSEPKAEFITVGSGTVVSGISAVMSPG